MYVCMCKEARTCVLDRSEHMMLIPMEIIYIYIYIYIYTCTYMMLIPICIITSFLFNASDPCRLHTCMYACVWKTHTIMPPGGGPSCEGVQGTIVCVCFCVRQYECQDNFTCVHACRRPSDWSCDTQTLQHLSMQMSCLLTSYTNSHTSEFATSQHTSLMLTHSFVNTWNRISCPASNMCVHMHNAYT
jgi:hypothetical protein